MNSVANLPYAQSPSAGSLARARGATPVVTDPVRDGDGVDKPRWRRLDPRVGQAHAVFTYTRAAAPPGAPGRGTFVDLFA